MTRDRYFILDGHGQPVRVGTVEEWARWSEANREARIIGSNTVSGADVSTVFLGIDHQWGSDGPPLIFETMIFGGRWDNYQWRWSTRAEAEASHAQVVEALQTGQPPLDAEGPEVVIGERPDDAEPGVCIGGGLPPQPGDVDLPVLKLPPHVDDLRALLRADRPNRYADTHEITKEYALAELRRYRDLYPNVAPEVAAFGLVRLVDQWDELRAIQIALDIAIKEASDD